MARFRKIGQAWSYISRIQGNRTLWTIVYFEKQGAPVSEYYVFSSSPYVGNAMHGVAQKVLSNLGVVMTPENRNVVSGLTRKFSDAFRDYHFDHGGKEMGGHAEEHFAHWFHRIYPTIIDHRPDTAVIINSDSPCTTADRAPSRPLTACRPNNPHQTINLGASCTTKLNTIAAYTPEIPHWEVYYMKKYGAWTARKGSDEVLNARDTAENQILTARHINVREATGVMLMTANMYGVT